MRAIPTMKTTLLTVGRIRPPFDAADAHYRKLLRRHQPVEVVEARDDSDLLKRLPRGARPVAIDVRGRGMDSIGWSRWLEQRRLDARDVCLMVGGPNGLSEEARDRAEELLSLGPQTMAHQLARVVVLEQIFRASKILAGERYHH